MNRSVRMALLLAALVSLAACGGKPAPQATAAAPPKLASITVHRVDAHREQTWDGVVEAVHRATLYAQTSGRVLELPYDVNDFVTKGDVVVRFTDVEQKSARRQAQAQLASARAAYKEAEANYSRVSEIYAQRLVAKADYDQALARRDAAKAALKAAEAGLSGVGERLDYTTVRAPYDGYVTKRWVQVGEAVQPGQPLVSGVSLKQLRVSVQVPQSAVQAIRAFHQAEIVLNGERIKVDRVIVFPYADPDTHTFNVRLELDGGHPGLYPGMTVKAVFAVGQARPLLVPETALWHQGEVTGVYVIGKHGVALRQVRVGDRFGDRVEVLSGLSDGDVVASDPDAAARYLSGLHAGPSA